MSLLAFVLAVWLPNLGLIIKLVLSDAPFSFKVGLPLSLLGSISTNFTFLSAFYTVAIAVLFGMNIAMAIFFLRRRIAVIKQSGLTTGILGVASGILGVGCAACGSFILTTLFTWLGVGAVISSLPFAGREFGILGVILLAISVSLTAKQIQDPLICKIK